MQQNCAYACTACTSCTGMCALFTCTCALCMRRPLFLQVFMLVFPGERVSPRRDRNFGIMPQKHCWVFSQLRGCAVEIQKHRLYAMSAPRWYLRLRRLVGAAVLSSCQQMFGNPDAGLRTMCLRAAPFHLPRCPNV